MFSKLFPKTHKKNKKLEYYLKKYNDARFVVIAQKAYIEMQQFNIEALKSKFDEIYNASLSSKKIYERSIESRNEGLFIDAIKIASDINITEGD